MKRLLIACALAVAAPAGASAQPAPPPVTIPAALAMAIAQHLSAGGTIAAGNEFARELVEAARAPEADAEREAALRSRVAELEYSRRFH